MAQAVAATKRGIKGMRCRLSEVMLMRIARAAASTAPNPNDRTFCATFDQSQTASHTIGPKYTTWATKKIPGLTNASNDVVLMKCLTEIPGDDGTSQSHTVTLTAITKVRHKITLRALVSGNGQRSRRRTSRSSNRRVAAAK